MCQCIDVSNIFILIIILSCSKKNERCYLEEWKKQSGDTQFITWEVLGGELWHSQTCPSYAEIQGQG